MKLVTISHHFRQLEKEVAGLPSARYWWPILGQKLNFLSLFCGANRQKRDFLFYFPCLILNIGENIKKYRTKQGLSQEDFARKSSVKYITLTKIEIGALL